MEQPSAQQLFFQHIRNNISQHLSLVDEVAELLNISTDSAYRRIRGEKPISFEELQVLCKKYRISLDQILDINSNSFLFSGNLANSINFTFENYLQDMLKQLEFMNSFASKHLYFLCKDMPPMAHFQIPELISFRCFLWMKSILQIDELRTRKFSPDDIDPKYMALCKKILDLYNQIPTTEIWSSESINILIRQILFYRDSDLFVSAKVASVLLDKAEELIKHLEHQAELGLKFRIGNEPLSTAASYRMFNNEIVLGDNTIFCELDGNRVCYINHSVINFMMTRNTAFNDYMYKCLHNIISKSTQISAVGERERSRFFNRMREKLRHARHD